MKYSADPHLRQLALEAAQHVTTDAGRMHKDDVLDDLCARIREREDLNGAVLRKAAQALMRDLGERRSPRRNRRTGGLYHPESIMKLGNGIWVWMKHTTQTDMSQWGVICARNTIRTMTAGADNQQYVYERTDAFRANPGITTLHPLELSVFHYRQDTLDGTDWDEDHGEL
ncbi:MULTISPECIES: hypothetical protein [Streptomyces]|uniref:hypothetical protein n=1 Tax=Streptomyces TaxID=1883 RepID=UPI00225B7FB6|nr:MULTISPECIES: hypothetical protein [Streptomyces]MCX5278348.1 hypothetical protein [Streptomyces virginiae]MCX5582991.1 hypothetical protein [Streptomyces erythrochromogenes]